MAPSEPAVLHYYGSHEGAGYDEVRPSVFNGLLAANLQPSDARGRSPGRRSPIDGPKLIGDGQPFQHEVCLRHSFNLYGRTLSVEMKPPRAGDSTEH
ncbi:MAG: hypothetical protein K0R38_950 [Polyangiaceae bacterium]|nr:hypothetical protein [Polyangiaceae bacterium]